MLLGEKGDGDGDGDGRLAVGLTHQLSAQIRSTLLRKGPKSTATGLNVSGDKGKLA